jgi:hypothetical protein
MIKLIKLPKLVSFQNFIKIHFIEILKLQIQQMCQIITLYQKDKWLNEKEVFLEKNKE